MFVPAFVGDEMFSSISVSLAVFVTLILALEAGLVMVLLKFLDVPPAADDILAAFLENLIDLAVLGVSTILVLLAGDVFILSSRPFSDLIVLNKALSLFLDNWPAVGVVIFSSLYLDWPAAGDFFLSTLLEDLIILEGILFVRPMLND